jgi:TetR/AcrR family transcriptional regulator, cholesterol catabolism regulator
MIQKPDPVQRSEKPPLASAQSSGKTTGKKRVRLTQKVIVETAAELFARKGFGATSLDDIAERLGATKGALYYHIKNKEEILRLIYLMVLSVSEEPLRRIVEASLSPAEKLGQAIIHHTAVAANRSPAMTVFYREQHHLSGPFAKEIILRKKEYERYFEYIIQEGQETGVFTTDLAPKIAAFGLLGMCNWLSQWYRPGGQYSAQQIAEMFVVMVERGLLAAPSYEKNMTEEFD